MSITYDKNVVTVSRFVSCREPPTQAARSTTSWTPFYPIDAGHEMPITSQVGLYYSLMLAVRINGETV